MIRLLGRAAFLLVFACLSPVILVGLACSLVWAAFWLGWGLVEAWGRV